MLSPIDSTARPFASRSLVARWAEPWAAGVWGLLLFWTALVAVVWGANIGESDVEARVATPELRAALLWLLRAADFLWVALAAVNGYFALVRSEGLNTARRWALLVFGVVFAVAMCSAWTGWPLGAIRYTTRFGPKLGPVPLGLPLLWFVVVIGTRSVLLRTQPHASHTRVASEMAGVVAALAMLIEVVAIKVRVWWFLPSSIRSDASPPPHLSAVAIWFLVGGALGFLLREMRVTRRTSPGASKQELTLWMLLGLLLVAVTRLAIDSCE